MKSLLFSLLILLFAMESVQARNNDEQQILQLYEQMYQAMIDKDSLLLEKIHDDTFVLIHMTGMRQSKQQYIAAIADGTLNYYAAKTILTNIRVEDDLAEMTGRSQVTAAVFGGGIHTWPLQLVLKLIRRPEGWKFYEAQASTY